MIFTVFYGIGAVLFFAGDICYHLFVDTDALREIQKEVKNNPSSFEFEYGPSSRAEKLFNFLAGAAIRSLFWLPGSIGYGLFKLISFLCQRLYDFVMGLDPDSLPKLVISNKKPEENDEDSLNEVQDSSEN